MKAAAENKPATVAASIQKKSEKPFFQKNGADGFFSKESSPRAGGGWASGDGPFFIPSNTGTRPSIQAKLTIGSPDDPLEREADHMADQVVQRMSSAGAGAGTAEERMREDKLVQEKPMVQRKCAACEEEEIQAKPGNGIKNVIQRLDMGVEGLTEARVGRELARRYAARGAGIAGRRASQRMQRSIMYQFWRVVGRRFATRGAAALLTAAIDGPLPIGDLIAIGMTIYTIWEIIEIWDELMLEAERLSLEEPVPLPEPETIPEEAPQPETDTRTRRRRRPRTCSMEPCPEPLPISWPWQLPLPVFFRPLIRISSESREWEGTDRGVAQRHFSDEIRQARWNLVPPPNPCFEEENEPNAPYDAHHTHPLYLGGEDAEYNLCSVETGQHMAGHRRLDNQAEFTDVYLECGICSSQLKHHPLGQTYEVVASK